MSASVTTGPNGHHGSAPGHGRKGSARVLPHINDIQESPADVNIKMPIRTLLDKAEALLAESRAARDFNRPELAFRAYLQASIIAIKMVNSHPEYVLLQADGSGLHRRHTAILLRISEQHDTFAAIKQDIISNNRLHGTLPKKQRTESPRPPQSVSPSSSLVNGKKEKPPVRPKPRELQSKPAGSHSADDLTARFSKLGGPVASPGQDPRIRTHPPIVPPPATALVSGFNQSTGLPRPPAAIYMSPRGTVSDEAAALPTSTPGGLFSRTPSFPTGNRGSISGTDYFTPPRTVPAAPKNKSFTIPESITISVEEVQQLLSDGAQVLFIDVRERDAYNEGHINAQFIICIESSILHGDDLTADDLRERMVISPDAELDLFDRREKFDLVVFYDDDATQVPLYASSSEEKSYLVVLKRVLYYLSVGQKTDAKLLHGGINSWLDRFGSQCLVATGDQPRPRRAPRGSVSGRPQVKYVPQKDVSEAELRALNERLDSGVNFIRNREDFFTRFPEVPAAPESMTGQKPPSSKPPAPKPREPIYPGISDIPAAPTRPAPTVAKPSVGGLKPGEDTSGPAGLRGPAAVKSAKKMTGLHNPGNWCFANSSVQSLRMSPGFGAELSSKSWEATWKIPKLQAEKSEHPRIMARIVANLFHWLNSGNFSEMKAQTLMEYSGALTRHLGPDASFSGNRQQDAQEFMSWLFDALTQETNTSRGSGLPNPPRNIVLKGQSVLQRAVEWWDHHSKTSTSIIDKYWRFFEITSTECAVCKNRTFMAETSEMLIARPVGENTGPKTLLEALSNDNSATIDDFQCDKCAKKQPATRRRRLGRMPDLLCLHISAFSHDGTSGKIYKKMPWDLNNVNLGPYFIDPEDRQVPPGTHLDGHYQGPFIYECYAVLMHSGPSISSGHYFVYARDPTNADPNQWYEFNDRMVHPVGDISKAVFQSGGDRIPYLAFFRRKHGRAGAVGSSF